jgi:hypothetical protein
MDVSKGWVHGIVVVVSPKNRVSVTDSSHMWVKKAVGGIGDRVAMSSANGGNRSGQTQRSENEGKWCTANSVACITKREKLSH